jgi:hypothetical protein
MVPEATRIGCSTGDSLPIQDGCITAMWGHEKVHVRLFKRLIYLYDERPAMIQPAFDDFVCGTRFHESAREAFDVWSVFFSACGSPI